MERRQIDFLNHGVLPFVGRDAELGRVVEFWGESASSQGLRALVLTGEAGVGKSRLIDEAITRITARGGAVVHLRLYPDSTTSLFPLIVRALLRSPLAGGLLRDEPEESITGVVDALSRMASLRQTLLVIEDLHLLENDGVADLRALLMRLVDEPISLLGAMRPEQTLARAVLEPYVVGDITLKGLGDEDILWLCSALFDESLDDRMITLMREKTAGNALALRSVLRAGFQRHGNLGLLDPAVFADALEFNVRLLSEGMAAHLSQADQSAARRLATLGEVFARPAAEHLLDGDADAIEALIFKGVLVNTPFAPTPVGGGSSVGGVLAFSHSLLHLHFVAEATFDSTAVVELLSLGMPLYSFVPIRLLSSSDNGDPTNTVSELASAAERLLDMSEATENSPDWMQGQMVWSAGDRLVRLASPAMDPTARRDLEVRVIGVQLFLQRRGRAETYPALVERLLELTDVVESEHEAELRLMALVFKRRLLKLDRLAESVAVVDEARAVLERFPSAMFTKAWALHLDESARAAARMPDLAFRRSVEAMINQVIDSPRASAEIRRQLRFNALPHLAYLYETEAELEHRLEISRALLEESRGQFTIVVDRAAVLHLVAGYPRRTLEIVNSALPLLRERGLTREIALMHSYSFTCRTLLGEPIAERGAELLEYIDEQREADRHINTTTARYYIELSAALCNQHQWAETVLGSLQQPFADSVRHTTFYHAMIVGDAALLEYPIADAPELVERLQVLIDMMLGRTPADQQRAVDAVTPLLTTPVLTLDEVVSAMLIVELLSRIDQREDSSTMLIESLRSAIEELFGTIAEWLSGRELPVVLEAVLEFLDRHMAAASMKRWRSKLRALERAAAGAEGSGEISKVKVSLFDTITVSRNGAEPQRIKGAQLCTMLGAMVADRLLDSRLTGPELMAIAIGMERDPDSARKSFNFAVFRLRELLGGEAIITGGDTPELDLNLVEVDLITAYRHLDAAETALRDMSIGRTLPELVAALDLAAGRVAFPALYDNFFEAAREDFENRLRDVLLEAVKLMMREGDDAGAENVLRRAYQAMPEDDELAELLQQVLRRLGRRTEAARIGLRNALV